MKIFGYNITKDVIKQAPKSIPNDIPPMPGRKAKPTLDFTYTDIKNGVTFINPGYIAELIPVIRKLSWVNPDIGLSVNDMVQLTNTGHRIKFHHTVAPEQRDKMLTHLKEARKKWGDGVHSIDGLVNKMVAQIWISGALSNEWVINKDKTGVFNSVLVNPETIRFSWNKRKQRFIPYQKQNFKTGGILGEKHVKLNPFTFKYFGLNGDTEVPYGIPPFLTALNNLDTQSDMEKSIKYIMAQLGLLGFFQTKVEKPYQNDGETDDKFKARLDTYLDEVQKAVKDGLKDGTIIGFKDDHEFEFQSTTKNLSGTSDLFKLNQIRVANGLKISPEFLGFPTGGSESGLSIIFTKMLSQLVNVQKMVANSLEFGYELELKLAGFKNYDLEVEFGPSTITDELKYQQGQEYKIRNVENKYNMGVISQQQKAEELGYAKPDEDEPRAPIDGSAKDKQDREDDKDTSDRKTRDKNKPVPKRKDSDTKPK